MGGHGGLNILPQKRWNVYNFDNREKVRKDEESAAKSAQHDRDLSRRHSSHLRLLQLRRTRHPSPPPPPPPPAVPAASPAAVPAETPNDSNHINLFEGIKIFDPVRVDMTKRKRRDEEESERRKKMMKTMRMKKDDEPRDVGPEDDKYRLGYGVAGKGVKAPWYALKRHNFQDKEADKETETERSEVVKRRITGKKSVEELREERLRREAAEKKRERALLSSSRGRDGGRRQWR
ncbi:hypothetical protein vseg_006388 [Gypsophila vaccaria]